MISIKSLPPAELSPDLLARFRHRQHITAQWERRAGFGSVDGPLLGERARYANLTMLFVDDGFQRQGIGRRLFSGLKAQAGAMGAERLFLSAVPSAETVAFYLAMGCRDGEEIPPQFVDTEKDRYLECPLAGGGRL